MIIVEDGTGVLNANSYNSVADFNAYRASRGDIELLNIEVMEKALTDAAIFIDKFEDRMRGAKVSPIQPLSYPRHSVHISCVEYTALEIMPIIKKASLEAATLALTNSINPSTSGSLVTRKRIEGVIDTTYDVSGCSSSFKASSVEVILKPLLKAQSMSVSRA